MHVIVWLILNLVNKIYDYIYIFYLELSPVGVRNCIVVVFFIRHNQLRVLQNLINSRLLINKKKTILPHYTNYLFIYNI